MHMFAEAKETAILKRVEKMPMDANIDFARLRIDTKAPLYQVHLVNPVKFSDVHQIRVVLHNPKAVFDSICNQS